MGVIAPIVAFLNEDNFYYRVGENIKAKAGVQYHDYFNTTIPGALGFAVSRYKYINAKTPTCMFSLYILAHECGHVSLNHSLIAVKHIVTKEIEADLMAKVLMLSENVHMFHDAPGFDLTWCQYIYDYHTRTIDSLNVYELEHRQNELKACGNLVREFHDSPNIAAFVQAIYKHRYGLSDRLIMGVEKVYDDYLEKRSLPLPQRALSRAIA
jgi:hypothetical protein